jgi:C-terminal processing protease CtpA/Prc
MRVIRTYSPFVNGKYQDRWSFAMNKTTWENYVNGSSQDAGIEYSFLSSTDLRVKLVYSQSSAGLQGVKRGWQVLKINGVDGTVANIDQLNTELSKTSQTIVFAKPDGSQQTLLLTVGAYKSDYVINPKVFTVNGKNVGYFAFDSFLGEAINGKTAQSTLNLLDEVFTQFKANNVTDLILDLRYNGGGYGLVANYLANLIAPTSAVGKVFAKTEHNTLYSSYNSINYFKQSTNGLNLSRVVIIVNKGTASASEELINGLKAVMDVKLIGNTTHGKPVGYYAIPTMDYYAFPVAFKNVNAAGTGDFYEGFTPDKIQTDDVTHDLGDASEACLNTALTYISTGVLQGSPQATRISAEIENYNTKIAKERLKITVNTFPKK